MLQGTKPQCRSLRRRKFLKKSLNSSNRNQASQKITVLVRPHLLYSHKTMNKTIHNQYQTLKRKYLKTLADKALSRTTKSLKFQFKSPRQYRLKTLSQNKVAEIRRTSSTAWTTRLTTRTRSRVLGSQTCTGASPRHSMIQVSKSQVAGTVETAAVYSKWATASRRFNFDDPNQQRNGQLSIRFAQGISSAVF